MTLNRITRDRRLTPEEAAKYREVRQQIAGELPEHVARHQARLEAREQLEKLLKELRAEREKRGLDLTDLTRLTGLKPSAVATLEADSSPDPTIETLARYAEVVGKRLTVSLTDVI